jgi:hypothetical protein
MIFTEQAVEDLTPHMSCSDTEDSRLRPAAWNGLLDEVAGAVASSEKTL